MSQISKVRKISSRPMTRRQFGALISSAVVSAVLSEAYLTRPSAFGAEPEEGKIAIVHTNDVHCSIEPSTDKNGVITSLGYAGVSAVYKQTQSQYGTDNSVLVDAGDFAQGLSTGTLTKGAALISLMDDCGYSYVTLGNHDFDYGPDRTIELLTNAHFQTVCCNLVLTEDGTNPVQPFAMRTMAGKKVAFLGITTPETLKKTSPSAIKDQDGNYLVGFHEDSTGQALYECVQNAVDQARSQGADFVVALGHLGQSEITQRWRSDTVVANTSGIDVVIDGHSHETYIKTVTNKKGEDVLITQRGTTLTSVGRVVIDTTVTPARITAESVTPPVDPEPVVAAKVAQVEDSLASIKGRKVAYSPYDLRVTESDNYTWAVRAHETNLGDLVTDAYRVRMGADIGICNGGGIRCDVPAGDITYGQMIDVNPFSNNLCLLKAKGSTILDALEFEFRGFPDHSSDIIQVSGITFDIRTDIASTVETDDMGSYVRVAGDRRIENVKVAGQPLDADAEYTVAGSVYLLISGGGGRTMWKDSQVLVAEGTVDFQALSDFLTEDLAGTVGEDYQSATGAGRFKGKDGPDPLPDNDDNDNKDNKDNKDNTNTGGSESSDAKTTGSASTAKTGDGASAVIAAGSAVAVAAAAVVASGIAQLGEDL